MNYTLLERVICDTIKEEQIKLGYERETIRLYYPMNSLANILEEDILDTERMDEVLNEFINKAGKHLGMLRVSHKEDRYCIIIPPEGAVYVHENYENNPFLEEFIDAVRKHSCTLENLLTIFHTYSEQVVCEKSGMEEFDYVLYFGDGKPDDYRYCIKFEGDHTTYHRFLKKDYEAL